MWNEKVENNQMNVFKTVRKNYGESFVRALELSIINFVVWRKKKALKIDS